MGGENNMGNLVMSDEDEFSEKDSNSNEEGDSDGSDENSDSSKEGEEEKKSDSDNSGGEGTEDDGKGGSDSSEGDDEKESEAGKDSEKGTETREGEGAEGDGKEESRDGESGDDKDSEGEKGEGESGAEEEDFFSDIDGESSEGEGESKAVDFRKIGESLDIELEEGTQEEFTTKVNQKIKDAQQEVDVSGFDPEAQQLVKHLNENEGKLGDFFINPKITSLQNVLLMDAEQKFKMVRQQELAKDGGTQEEINQEIDEEIGKMSAQQIVNVANKINSDAQNLIAAEINEIVGQSEQNTQAKKDKTAKEAKETRDDLKNYVQEQDDFLGLKLTEKAKSRITVDIDSGRFDKVVDLTDAEIRFAAYMIKRSGSNIKKQFAKQLTESSRLGYNKGIDKSTDKLHKNKDDAEGLRTGHEQSSEGKKNFDNWADIE